MPPTVRNVLIIVALAAIIWKVPGGGTASNVVQNLLSILLLGGLTFFAARMYLEHRVSLHGLGDRNRGILYASIGLIVLAIAATGRMWDGGGATLLLWFAMIGAAAYGIYLVVREARAY